MSDLRIDYAPGASRDLVFTAGRLEIVRGPEARAQRASIAVYHFLGEWFLDQNAGTDYFGKIYGKAGELTRRTELRRRILSVPGIVEITSMTLRIDPQTRALSGTIEARDIGGEVVVVVITDEEPPEA